MFIDGSVDTGDISDDLDDQTIRELIRDDYLRDTTVTILLVGTETQNRKHIDWEIYSSMRDGKINRKSGILVVMLPSTGCTSHYASHGDLEKSSIYPNTSNWYTLTSRKEFEDTYPYLPARIIDNLLSSAKISIVNWETIESNWDILRYLIDLTFNDKQSCEYDFSRPMRRKNS